VFSFGLAIVALAAVVAPGVLFVVSFFSVSIIKRTSISFGPAIDLAVFFSLSLLINGAYGGFIGWLALHLYNPCAPRHLIEIIGTLDRLAHGADAIGGCAEPDTDCFFYLYLALLCVVSCAAGAIAVRLAEELGVGIVHGLFTRVASTARTGGATICSALCRFGGENSFVIYIGEVRWIVLDDKNAVNYLSMSLTRRSLLKIANEITASEPEAIPSVSIIIPGSSIENLAFAHMAVYAQSRLRSYGVFIMYTLLLTAPFVGSLSVYDDVFFAHKASLGALPPPGVDAQALAAAAVPVEPLVIPMPALNLLLDWERRNGLATDDALRTLSASLEALEGTAVRARDHGVALATALATLATGIDKLNQDRGHAAGPPLARHHAVQKR
jgi:hypothetical protein